MGTLEKLKAFSSHKWRENKINDILISRYEKLKVNYNDPEVDRLTQDIISKLRMWMDHLSPMFMLSVATYLGSAPSLLYNDNGGWAVEGSGYQDLCLDNDPNNRTNMNFSVKNSKWVDTIEEAVLNYIKAYCDPSEDDD